MSPDPSVHEESLRAIEKERRRKPRKGWSGCLVTLLVLAAAGAAAAYLFRDKWQPLLTREYYESLAKKGAALRRTPPRQIIQDLRAKAASLETEWEDLTASGTLRGRLESLRDDLASRRDQASETARKEWEEMVRKSEDLLEKARRQKEKLPPVELGELRKKLERLENASRALSGSGKPEQGKEQVKPEDKKPDQSDESNP